MAAFERNPSRWKGTRFRRGLGASRIVAQAILSLTEKDRQKRWPTFPMGLRSKGTFRSASSYLLHQLIHRSHEAEGDQEEEQQEEGESEESEESEMQNLEVCLPPSPTPVSQGSLQPRILAASVAACFSTPPSLGSAHSFRARGQGLFLAAFFYSLISDVLHLLSWRRGVKPSKYLLSFHGFLCVRLHTVIMKKISMGLMLSKVCVDKILHYYKIGKGWSLIFHICLSELKYFRTTPSFGPFVIFLPPG